MKTTCPACGAVASLDVLLAHEDARAAITAAMRISAPLASRLMRYIALFRPSSRQLTMDRLANLLNELLPLIQEAKVSRNGRIYAAPIDTWKHALDEMVNRRERLTLPLKSHGYLLEIIVSLADKQEATEERQTEATRRYAYAQTRSSAGPVSAGEALAAAVSAPQAGEGKRPIPETVRADLARYAPRKSAAEESPNGTDQG